MPITTPAVITAPDRRTAGPHRVDRLAWYPIVEAIWALVIVVAFIAVPVDVLEPWFAIVLAPGAVFAFVRLCAGLSDLRGGVL